MNNLTLDQFKATTKDSNSRLTLDQFKAKNSKIENLEKLTGGILGACHPEQPKGDASAEALNGLRGLMDWWK
jgi:hypothetical protein